MGEEGSKHVFERVADVLARLGGDPRGARPETRGSESGAHRAPASGSTHDRSSDGEPGRAVTDGGANGAPPGDVPWGDDDPIVFGEADDTDPGAAILEAVTDDETEAAPPFGGGDASADTQPETERDGTDGDGPDGDGPDADAVDPDRLDELEARLDALEGDHVQLETRLADVARDVASIGEDLSTTAEDVRLLVATLGGIAIARDGAGGSPEDSSDLAAALDGIDADELEATLGRSPFVDESRDDVDASNAGKRGADEDIDTGADENTDTDSVESDDAPVDAKFDGEDDEKSDEDSIPEGIHRGAGEAPTPSSEDDAVLHDDRPAKAETRGARDATGDRTTGEPARELVDPRTDAVGARLRQFRENFVDDPTEDLPTGNAAEEFQFEKVLLPTDGEEAPDLSDAELEKPYLETLPDGYAADAVVLEWLDWLVSAADGEVAAQAVDYYESIDWVTETVRDDLLAYLDGLGKTPSAQGSAGTKRDDVVEPPAALDLQDHLRSLQYVTELAPGEVEADGI